MSSRPSQLGAEKKLFFCSLTSEPRRPMVGDDMQLRNRHDIAVTQARDFSAAGAVGKEMGTNDIEQIEGNAVFLSKAK